MELFGYIGWITVPEYIVNLVLQFGNISVDSFAQSIAIARLCYFIILSAGLGLFLVGVIFGGIGLLKLSKRAGIKHGWIGFFPFANTYLTGELAGQTSIFNTRIKRIGLWAMLCEIAIVALNIFGFTLQILLMRPEYYAPVMNSAGEVEYELAAEYIPAALRWMFTANTAVYIVEMIFSFVVLFMFCTLFFAFYRKYYARSPFLMTFLSAVLPGRGFAIFAVRNNTPIDYAALMRRRMQQYQQQQQQQQGGYGPQGTYAPPSRPEEPFGDEFGTPAGSPQSPPPPSQGPAQGAPPPEDDNPFSDF